MSKLKTKPAQKANSTKVVNFWRLQEEFIDPSPDNNTTVRRFVTQDLTPREVAIMQEMLRRLDELREDVADALNRKRDK